MKNLRKISIPLTAPKIEYISLKENSIVELSWKNENELGFTTYTYANDSDIPLYRSFEITGKSVFKELNEYKTYEFCAATCVTDGHILTQGKFSHRFLFTFFVIIFNFNSHIIFFSK